MIRIDLEETNRSAHRVTVNSRGPRTKPCEYWWQKTRDKVLALLTQERVYHYFFRHGCSKGDKKMKLSCSKCHLSFFFFFTPVANDKAEHLPVPFVITPFSFTPTIAARPHKRDWIPFAICTSPVIHLVCPPNILYMHCLQFLLGRLQHSGEIKKFGGCKQGVLQEVCKWGMLFAKSGVYNPGQNPLRQ